MSETNIQIVTIIILGLLGLIGGIAAIRVVLTSSILKGIVRHYCLCIIISSSLINLSHLFWGAPRALWSSLSKYDVLDNTIGFIAFTSVSVMYIAKILLAFNRFMAISWNGAYYRSLEKVQFIQYFLLIAYSVIMSAPMLFPGFRVIWVNDGKSFWFIEDSPNAELYMNITQPWAAYFVIAICTSLDSMTFFLIKKRIMVKI
ncbi:unnamed protein product, partial [Mesorhabditis belari]|uniref:7TM GPCR serpentine receptor class x (Srx) domain-containing protein n=1 Tax=Mesorhabditis belari TaxID=2138241 RepID=A0AAF3FMX8_9BILA